MKRRTLDGLREVTLRPGVHHKVFSGEGATLAWGRLEPGHELKPHSHPHEQIVYMVAGPEVRFTVDEEATLMNPGDMIVVPGGVTHFVENLGEEDAIELSVFSPVRADYALEEDPEPA